MTGSCSHNVTCLSFRSLLCAIDKAWWSTNGLYCFTLMLRYWIHHQLPTARLYFALTIRCFRKSQGKLFSVLSTSQPSINRTKLEQVRKAWQFVRSRFDLHSSTDGYSNKNKKYRILSKSFLFSYLFIFFIVWPCSCLHFTDLKSIILKFYTSPTVFLNLIFSIISYSALWVCSF